MASPWAWAWTAWTRTPWGSGTVRSPSTTTARRRTSRAPTTTNRSTAKARTPSAAPRTTSPGGCRASSPRRGAAAARSRSWSCEWGGANELDQRARARLAARRVRDSPREPPVRRRRRGDYRARAPTATPRATSGEAGSRATSSRCAGRWTTRGATPRAARDHARPARAGEMPGETLPAPPRSSPTRRGDPAPTPPSPGPPRTPCCSARGSATRVSPRGPPTPPPRTRPRPAPAPAVRRPRCPPAAPVDRGAAADGVASVCSGEHLRRDVPPGGGARRRRLPRRRRGARAPRVRTDSGFVVLPENGVARVPAPHRARVRPSQRRARPTTRGLPGRDGASRLVRVSDARAVAAWRDCSALGPNEGVPRASPPARRRTRGSGDCALGPPSAASGGGTRGENEKAAAARRRRSSSTSGRRDGAPRWGRRGATAPQRAAGGATRAPGRRASCGSTTSPRRPSPRLPLTRPPSPPRGRWSLRLRLPPRRWTPSSWNAAPRDAAPRAGRRQPRHRAFQRAAIAALAVGPPPPSTRATRAQTSRTPRTPSHREWKLPTLLDGVPRRAAPGHPLAAAQQQTREVQRGARAHIARADRRAAEAEAERARLDASPSASAEGEVSMDFAPRACRGSGTPRRRARRRTAALEARRSRRGAGVTVRAPPASRRRRGRRSSEEPALPRRWSSSRL